MSPQETSDASQRLAMLRKAIQDRHHVLSRPRPAKAPDSVVPCRFFSRGLCQRSGSCPFGHFVRGSVSTSRSNKLIELERHKLSSSPQSRLQILNDLLDSHRQRRNKKLASSSYPTTIPSKPNQLSMKSMSWVRAGFTPESRRRPSSDRASTKPKSLFINGLKFRLSNCGRTLVRCQDETQSSSSIQQQPHRIIPSRVQLNGVNFIKTSAGALVRSSVQGSRRTASQRLKRSLQLVRSKKLDKRKQQFCMFFCRFGFCKLNKLCPFIHDTSKVAICRTFVANGVCSTPETCLLSHTLDRSKMPECSHFLKGICAKGDFCPYRHVKVSEDAAFCQDFIRGYCSLGEQCKLRHAYTSRKGKSASAAGQVDEVLSSTQSDRHIV